MEVIKYEVGKDNVIIPADKKTQARITLAEEFLDKTSNGNDNDYVVLEFIQTPNEANNNTPFGFCVEYNLDKTIKVIKFYASFEEACRAFNEIKKTARLPENFEE